MVPITIANVSKFFGSTQALDGVNLNISAGELFFMLGPSGCGKTTLLRCVAGFCTPTGGRISFADRDVTHLPPQRRDTGMVFQNYALWPHMTVEANVAFGLKVRRVARAERQRRVAEALEMVQMSRYARRKPNQLSGGQQQRVALARALVIRPQALLLDEPLSNLDAKLRLDMRREIRRLCKQFGLTALYVTHDQKEALSIADRLAVMFDGRVTQVGAPRDLYRRPIDRRVADFLGESNFLDGQVKQSTADGCVVSTAIGDLRAADDRGPSAGDCSVSIRPEAIVVPADEGDVNRFEARVSEISYQGDASQLTLVAGAVTLRARVVERAGRTPIAAGDSVPCSIDPHEIVILESNSAVAN